MEKILTKIKKFIIKLKVCYNILTGKYQHWFIINLKREELVKLFKHEEFEINGQMCGIKDYVYKKTVKSMANSIDNTELELERIEFEFNATND